MNWRGKRGRMMRLSGRLVNRVHRIEALGSDGGGWVPYVEPTDEEVLSKIEDALDLERGAIPRDVADVAAWNEERGFGDYEWGDLDADPEQAPAQSIFDTIMILTASAWGCPRAEARATYERFFEEAEQRHEYRTINGRRYVRTRSEARR